MERDSDYAKRVTRDIRKALAKAARARRVKLGWTQKWVASCTKSTAPRVSMLEHADPGTSLERYLLTLLFLGIRQAEIGRLIAQAGKKPQKDETPGLFDEPPARAIG